MNIAKPIAAKRKSSYARHSAKRSNKPPRLSIIENIIKSKNVATADKALNEKYELNDFKGRLVFLKKNFIFCLADRHVPLHSEKKIDYIEKNDYWLVLQHIIGEIHDIGIEHVVKNSVLKCLNK
jgi:hypothetical protein